MKSTVMSTNTCGMCINKQQTNHLTEMGSDLPPPFVEVSCMSGPGAFLLFIFGSNWWLRSLDLPAIECLCGMKPP